MNYVAIDFEIANDEGCPCSVAVIVVEDGKVSNKYEALIKPKNRHFGWRQMQIHGITYEHVTKKSHSGVIVYKTGYASDSFLLTPWHTSFHPDEFFRNDSYHTTTPPKTSHEPWHWRDCTLRKNLYFLPHSRHRHGVEAIGVGL